MNFSNLICVTLVVVGINMALGQIARAQTRLGLHVTQEELNIWRQRAVSGPYKSAGDVSPNSPGDWDRIVANKDWYNTGSNHLATGTGDTASIWTGYTGTGCVPPNTTSISPISTAKRLRDAAFWALVMNNATMAARVRESLINQIGQAGTDLRNTSKWCVSGGYPSQISSTQPAFPASEWLVRVLYAYEYVKPFLNATDRTNIEAWFLNAGTYFRLNMFYFIESCYANETNFLNGTLSRNGNCADTPNQSFYGLTHLNGFGITQLSEFFNNRFAQMASAVGQVGAALDNTTLKNWGAAWVKEFIKYSIYPNGIPGSDIYRQCQSCPAGNGSVEEEGGWSYGAVSYQKTLSVADALARRGDTSLYEFSTSSKTAGMPAGSKTLKTSALFFARTANGTQVSHRDGTSAIDAHLINGVMVTTNGGFLTYDLWPSLGNIFWNDNEIKTAYLTPGATNKQGQTVNREPEYGFQGAGQAYPGLMFMFGQMEGKVWPYGENTSDPPAAPTNLRVISSDQ